MHGRSAQARLERQPVLDSARVTSLHASSRSLNFYYRDKLMVYSWHKIQDHSDAGQQSTDGSYLSGHWIVRDMATYFGQLRGIIAPVEPENLKFVQQKNLMAARDKVNVATIPKGASSTRSLRFARSGEQGAVWVISTEQCCA